VAITLAANPLPLDVKDRHTSRAVALTRARRNGLFHAPPLQGGGRQLFVNCVLPGRTVSGSQ
jgi:hypothetical protein